MSRIRATVTVPWQVEGHGLLALSTATLLERWEPYHLPLELARGTINRLRDQLFEWQAIGLTIPNEVRRRAGRVRSRSSVGPWSRRTMSRSRRPGPRKRSDMALDGSQLLAAAYAEQVIAVRRRRRGRLPSLLGGTLSGPAMDEAAAKVLPGRLQHGHGLPSAGATSRPAKADFAWSACDEQIAVVPRSTA